MKPTHHPCQKETLRIGVIGVGLLGSALAERLISAGYHVAGYDPRSFHVSAVQVAESVPELIQGSDVLFLSLPNSSVVSEVVRAHVAAFRRGHVVMDTTTGDPDQMMELHAWLKEREVSYLEANIAGSSQAMRSGDVTLFLGREPSIIQAHEDLITSLSPKFFHMGPVGMASRFKLVHNLVLGLHRLVLAEGLEFARSLGIDPEHALDILMKTPAFSSVMETKGPSMVHRDYDPPKARLVQHLNDVHLMLGQARATGAHVPLTSIHARLLGEAVRDGLGDMDNSAIVELFRKDHSKENPDG